MIPDNYTCEGQMNIWEMFKPKEDLPELKDIVMICKDKHRRSFKECEYDGRPTFIDTYKKAKISLYEDRFTIGECERFISVDLNTTTEGFGVPCKTIDQVLYWLDKAYKRADKLAKGE